MLATRVVCPFCSKRLKTSKPLDQGHRILCSRCSRSFPIGKETAPAAAPSTPPAEPPSLPEWVPTRVPPAPATPAPPAPRLSAATVPSADKEAESPSRSGVRTTCGSTLVTCSRSASCQRADTIRSGGSKLRLAAACLGLLVAAAGIILLCVHLAARKDHRETPVVAEQPAAPAEPQPLPQPEAPVEEPAPPGPVAVVPTQPVESPALPKPAPRPPVLQNKKPASAPPPLAAPAETAANAWLPAEEQARVHTAIERGVTFLKKTQEDTGTWPGFGAHRVGLAALPGLTLLECGVPAGDEHIQNAARLVRNAIPGMMQTYDIALSILFLDRLGEAEDRPRIQTLALRLLGGQTQAGGWTYNCPLLTPLMERDLLTVLRHQQPTALKGELASKAGTGSKALEPRPDMASAKKALESLPAPMRHLPALFEPSAEFRLPPFDETDNSNTQFAILGVWVAGRHGIPTERALHHIARRFRLSQAPSGGWGYHYTVPGVMGTPAMTGAGLLGLAVGLGLAEPDRTARDRKAAPPKDPAVEKGLRTLAEFIGKPSGKKRAGTWLRGSGIAGVNLYFLWTLERVGVLYNLRHIHGKDWYAWGTETLLDCQGEDGSWAQGGYPGAIGNMATVDTCFGLLFLKRTNLVQDLSRRLEFVIDVRSLHSRPGPP